MTKVITTNRGRPRAALRGAIYDAAIAMFREQGYAAATVESIAARAGVAKGTFFNFFPTKLDALKAYYGEIDAEVARIRKRLDPASPRAALRRYAKDVERKLRCEGALLLELLAVATEDASLRRIDEDSGSLDAEEFADFLRAAQQKGALSPTFEAGAAATALVDLWSGAMRAWRAAPERESLADLFDQRVGVLIEGLKP